MLTEFDLKNLKGIQEAYKRAGCVIVRNVLPSDLIRELDQHIDWLMKRDPTLEPERLGHWLIAEDPFWVRFVSDRHLLDLAEAFVGSDIAFFAADYIAKPPHTGKGVLWHQDGHYWPLEPMDVITIWFAVSASTRANGCVQVIPGSHHLGLQKHLTQKDEANLLNSVDPAALDESKAVDIELNPGDVSVHHPLILHGSKPNTSDHWRRGGSIQYMPPTTRITKDNWPSAFLFQGQVVEGINTYLPFPKFKAGEHMPFQGCE